MITVGSPVIRTAVASPAVITCSQIVGQHEVMLNSINLGTQEAVRASQEKMKRCIVSMFRGKRAVLLSSLRELCLAFHAQNVPCHFSVNGNRVQRYLVHVSLRLSGR